MSISQREIIAMCDDAGGEEAEATAATIQRRLQKIVKYLQEEHHLRVRLCMEAFPDLWTALAKWEWDDHKGDCPEWQLANERLLKRFGAIDGEPVRWGLRLRPPIMCERWDEDVAIDLGRAIRDDLFDAARSAVADQPVMVTTPPAAPKGEGTPVDEGKLTTNERMVVEFTRDPACIEWTAGKWAELLQVDASTIRKTRTWKTAITKERERSRSERRTRPGGKGKKVNPKRA